MSSYGPYTPIRQAGDLYFLSGQVGIDPETKQTNVDIAAQTQQTLDNLKELLEQNGLSMDDVIKTTIFLTDMDSFGAVNDVYMKYFQEPRPTRTCVEVAGLPKLAQHKLLIEIEAVAYRP